MTDHELEITFAAFRDLYEKAQTLAYEVAVRPQSGEDWKPVRHALDELLTCLDQVSPTPIS